MKRIDEEENKNVCQEKKTFAIDFCKSFFVVFVKSVKEPKTKKFYLQKPLS